MLLYIFIVAIIVNTGLSQLPSPCPDIFMYENSTEEDRWYGTITLKSNKELRGIWLHFTLDQKADLLGTWFGEASSKDNKEFTIKNVGYKLEQNAPLKIRLFVKYNTANVIPSVQLIRLNGKTICDINKPPPLCNEKLITYENKKNENDRWYGVISLKPVEDIYGVWLDLALDNKADLIGTWFGEASSSNNQEILIKNEQYLLEAGQVFPLKIFVKYNTSYVAPKIKNIRLNGNIICLNPDISPSQNGKNNNDPDAETIPLLPTVDLVSSSTEGTSSLPTMASIKSSPSPNINPTNFKNAECGKVSYRAAPFITNAQPTGPGLWPWHVALYNYEGTRLEYRCGGTLISETHILTAAHCVTSQTQGRNPPKLKNLMVFLGKYNLQIFNSATIQEGRINRIFVHPKYNVEKIYIHDIAVLELTEPALITDYVSPCCLWSEETNLSYVLDKYGTLVGWGYDENKKLSNKLQKQEMPVIPFLRCLSSNPNFYVNYVDQNVFCAGYLNGTSACNGDSGGGMIFPKGGTSGRNTVWQIRGIVSVGVSRQNEAICDASFYSVFTDVAKYLDWIKEVMTQ